MKTRLITAILFGALLFNTLLVDAAMAGSMRWR